MTRRILIIQGHPDPDPARFDRALAGAYREGARAAGHTVEVIDVAALGLAPLASRADWESGDPGEAVRRAQRMIEAAEHLVLFYPLWLGTMPAALKAFLEQVLRPDFAFGPEENGARPGGRLRGRSARVVVTMGMPAFFYRWFFGAHSLKSLERNILRFCGIRPVRETLVGGVESDRPRFHRRWLERMEAMGRKAR